MSLESSVRLTILPGESYPFSWRTDMTPLHNQPPGPQPIHPADYYTTDFSRDLQSIALSLLPPNRLILIHPADYYTLRYGLEVITYFL